LSKLGFCPTWIQWISSLYWFAFSSFKVNEEPGEDFKLARSVRQGCLLIPYLFILADDTSLYLKSSPSNLSKARTVLKLLCLASRAKINWGKSAAIWASKEKKEWEWGEEVGLRWIPEGQGVRYLGIQIGFRLPMKANFEKLMFTLKRKMIAWGKCNFFLTCRILIANQILFSSMWYLVACWNPNPRMCNLIRGVVRNFIWGGKVSNTWAKVKWDSFTLPLSSSGLGIIDPKAQSEALLAKLLVRGLAPGGEPWKEILRHRANQVHLQCTAKGQTSRI
jgi:hypothetical protein